MAETTTEQPVADARERITKATVSQRVNIILETLLDGWSRYQIVQMASKEWGIVPRTADKYISRAHKIIHILSEREANRMADKCERRLERLYYKALKNGDLNLARNIIKDLRDMFGLDAPARLAFTDPTGKKEANARIEVVLKAFEQFEEPQRQALIEALEGNGEMN